MIMDKVLPDSIQDWLDRTPKAKRAYERIRADLDSVAGWVDNTTRGELRDKVEAMIDPPSRSVPEQRSEVDAPKPEATDTTSQGESGGTP
jgi:hypothetical protein